ncbi:MAG: hypothetical protein HOH66_16930 [Rhodospirillaceae bacterium]|nr:hypothetical protein [Rhodospirillaceae bacterium]
MGGGEKPTLMLEAEGEKVAIALDTESSPRILLAVLERLPLAVDLHCAKLAGDQILWPTTVVMPLEGARSINDLPDAPFIYYPDRQFLEIIYAPIQDEEADVVYLGEASGHVDALQRLGEKVQAGQGNRVIRGRLSVGGDGAWVEDFRRRVHAMAPDPRYVDRPGVDALGHFGRSVREAAEAMADAPPAEIMTMMRRRGIMLPAGPLLNAQGETRKLHEALWALRERASAAGDKPLHSAIAVDDFVADAAAVLLRTAEDKLANFYGLHDAGGFAGRIADHFEETSEDARTMLDEVIVWVGRLDGWLDACIPWQAVNAAVERASDALVGDGG